MATLEQIQARVKKLQAQAEAIIAKRAQGALNQIRDLMLRHGLTTEDIEERAKAKRERARAERLGLTNGKAKAVSSSTTKGKLPPKYRDPKTGATWSGHARPPQWIKNVKDRTKFLIDAAAATAEPAVKVKAKATAKKASVKKATAAGAKATRKASSVSTKVAGKKTAAVKTVGKKTAAKKVAAKPAKPTAGKKAIAKKAATKKVTAKKTTAKKAAVKATLPAEVSVPVAAQAPIAANTTA
jgi:DNA-binding protein H-NS